MQYTLILDDYADGAKYNAMDAKVVVAPSLSE